MIKKWCTDFSSIFLVHHHVCTYIFISIISFSSLLCKMIWYIFIFLDLSLLFKLLIFLECTLIIFPNFFIVIFFFLKKKLGMHTSLIGIFYLYTVSIFLDVEWNIYLFYLFLWLIASQQVCLAHNHLSLSIFSFIYLDLSLIFFTRTHKYVMYPNILTHFFSTWVCVIFFILEKIIQLKKFEHIFGGILNR